MKEPLSHRSLKTRPVVFLVRTMALTNTQSAVQNTRKRAAAWATRLQFKEAALDLFALLFIIPSYIVGLLWYLIKYCVGLFVEGFKKGARHRES